MLRSLLLALALLLAAGPARAGDCKKRLTNAGVTEAIELGRDFLLRNQRPAGNFIYAYDWHRGEVVPGDSEVRQAGALWSLGILLREGQASTRGALENGLRFFLHHSAVAQGRRFLRYPGTDAGATGAVALVALAHIEHLRATQPRPAWSEKALEGYLAQLRAAHRRAGGFHRTHGHRDGAPEGAPSPYYDGETLLALVMAARHLGRRDLLPLIRAETESGFERHVTKPRRREPDPAQTKGYYQWASMAWYELATWPETAAEPQHGDRLLELATWMIDTHRTLSRRRNTAYAYEGIVPAWALATQRGDARAKRYGCTIEKGLAKLMSWQVGSSSANRAIRSRRADDKARGGVQNHRREPLLRIDVTQHQTHALLLARRLYLPTR